MQNLYKIINFKNKNLIQQISNIQENKKTIEIRLTNSNIFNFIYQSSKFCDQ